jgi:Protein of unknown function (DUF3551)
VFNLRCVGRAFAEEAIMRTIALLSVAFTAMIVSTGNVSAGSWCVRYERGSENCGYSSYEQCWAAARGLRAFCQPNPFPGTNFGTGSGTWGSAGSRRR